VGGPSSVVEQRWLAAIRAVYAGLLLTRTPAALWGGALLRLAHHLARGPSPSSLFGLAARYADPRCALSPTDAAKSVVGYLTRGELGCLLELQPLRAARAPWLLELCALGRRAAVATPLEGKRFGLIAVLCSPCASKGEGHGVPSLIAHVDTYDAAIRCPRCRAIVPHPLPGIAIGEPHPVARCVADATRRCLVHAGGHELDSEDLCADGQALYDAAVVELAGKGGSPTSRDIELFDALLRAQGRRRAPPAALVPVFAGLPEAELGPARAHSRRSIAPAEAEEPNLDRRAELGKVPGLSAVFASIESGVERGVTNFLDQLAARPPRPRRG
jgi:hypothetical protein